MPLDPNIILQTRGPQFENPMDIAQKGMSLKQLAMQTQALEQENSDKRTMSDILKKNTVTDASGNTSVNRGAALSDLYKVNPEKAMAFKKQIESEDLDNLKRNTELGYNFAWSATPENYQQIRQQAIQMGMLNADKLPEQYSPHFVQNWQMATLNGKDQLAYRMEQEKLGLERSKLNADKQAKSNEGTKALDKDYAKDYNDFIGGGRSKAKDALKKLRDLREEIAADNGMVQAGGGPWSGSMPDALRTQASIARRDNIVSVANSALKATFGGQLSDGERKALANEFYNDKLSNEENLKIIDRKIVELQHGLMDQDKKAKYFQQNKQTLAGYGAQDNLGQRPPAQNIPAPKSSRVEEIVKGADTPEKQAQKIKEAQELLAKRNKAPVAAR